MKTPPVLALCLLAAAVPAQIVHHEWHGDQDVSWMGFAVESLGEPDGGRRLLIGQPIYDHSLPIALIPQAGIVRCHAGDDPGGAPLFEVIGGVGHQLGRSLANLGDLDGDHFDDFAIGAPLGSVSTSFSQEGYVLVCSGKGGNILFILGGSQEYSRFGAAVGGPGDVSGDGTPDILVGAPDYDVSGQSLNGRVSVYSGKTGSFLQSYTGHANSRLGYSVCGVGDVNGDGRMDFAAGAPEDDTTALQAGRVVVLRGGLLTFVWEDLYGAATQDNFGWAVAGRGDANADGDLDLLIGAPGASGDTGLVQVRRGPDFTSALHTWVSSAAPDRLGSAVAFAGDVDRDGHDDIVMGASQIHGAVIGPGYVAGRSGKTGAAILAAQTGAGFGDDFGSSVAAAGDADGDGWDDVLVGAPFGDALAADGGGARLIGWQVVQPDVGGGGVGSTQLSVHGAALASGYGADLVVSGGPPGAPAWLLASALQLPLPFKGGTLVPGFGAGLLLFFPLNGQGGAKVLVPGGGGPFTAYVQAIVQDAAQPAGFALTSCVKLEFLP